MTPPMATSSAAPLRPPPGRLLRLLRHLNVVALLMVVAAAAGLLMYPSDDDRLLGLPDLEVGEIASRTVKSPRNFAIRDLDTEARLRAEAVARVRPVHDLVTGLGAQAKGRIEAGIAAVRGETQPESSRAVAFMRAVEAFFDDDAYAQLSGTGFTDEFFDGAIMVVRTIYEQQIVEDRALLELSAPSGIQIRVLAPDGSIDHEESAFDFTEIIGLDSARARVDQLTATELAHLPEKTRRAIAVLTKALLKANLLPNPAESDRRALAVGRAFKPLLIPIKAGEVVLREGERITERDLLVFEGIAGELESSSRLQRPLGGAALILLLVLALFAFHRRGPSPMRSSQRNLAFCAFVYVLWLLLLWGGYKGALRLAGAFPLAEVSAYRALLPLAWAPLLIRFVLGFGAAAAFLPLLAITAGWVMDGSIGYALYALIGGLAAASVRSDDRPRTQLLYAGAWCGLWQAAVVVLYALHESSLLPSTLTDATAAGLSGIGAALIAVVAVPVVEVLFGYSTAMKLTDLANLNHPLLRDMLVQAPGTYHHSIVVGALAEAAARDVGADRLLARVGGYYHDIGKLERPRVFKENNRSPEPDRPALELARDILGHVAHGHALASRHRLGKRLTDIILQHHGTGVVRDVYARFLEQGGGSLSAVDVAQFQYEGPKPATPEAALVLLADAVESSIGTLLADAPLADGALELTVDAVIAEAIADGQLDRCDLSLGDVSVVAAAMSEVLRDMLLRRSHPPSSELPAPDPRYVRSPPMDDLPN